MKDSAPQFAFSRRNYYLLFAGVLIIILGFTMMSGGGSDDPSVFEGEYVLDDASFEQLAEGQFRVDEAVSNKLEGLRNQEFDTEEALLQRVEEVLGKATYDANRFRIRSATTIHAAIFAAARITIAPIVVIFGYGFIFFAILYREKETAPKKP